MLSISCTRVSVERYSLSLLENNDFIQCNFFSLIYLFFFFIQFYPDNFALYMFVKIRDRNFT
jgi:hypothetical protein